MLLDSTVLSLRHDCRCHLVALVHPCSRCCVRLPESRHYHCCRRWRCDFVATCVGRGPVLASDNANHVVIGSGGLPPPPALPWVLAAAAQHRHCHRRQWCALPHASTGVRAVPGRRLPSGSATLSDEQKPPLQSKLCVPLHFNIWNPLHLDKNRRFRTYWYVPV